MLELIAGWIAFAAVVGVGARTRGREGFGWFLLAIVISPLLAGAFLLASPRKDQKEKDPFTDIATLAAIEATPEGSRSRQLLADHETKRAAKVKAYVQYEERRRVFVFVIIVLGLLVVGSMTPHAPATSQQASAHPTPTAERRSPMICGIAGPC